MAALPLAICGTISNDGAGSRPVVGSPRPRLSALCATAARAAPDRLRRGGLYASFDSFVLKRFGLQPDLLIDRRFTSGAATGQTDPEAFFCEGWKQVSPGDLVLVCLGDGTLLAEIRQRFAALGFTDVRSAYDIYEYNLIYAGEDFARDPLALYRREWDKLVHVHGLLCDDLSRQTYYKYLRTHVERKRPDFAPASYPVQYTPPDLPLVRERIRLLNCGAFTGDTIENFVRNYGSLDFVCALEPDPDNFEKLSRNELVHLGSASSMLLPLGASDSNASIFFESGQGMISRVAERASETATLVRTVALDTVARGMGFNKIVIDTEGHEMAILRGMRGIIKDRSPDICIACYHHPEDIFRIALLIEEMQPRYKFYLCNHSSVCVDTVLYATLQEAAE